MKIRALSSLANGIRSRKFSTSELRSQESSWKKDRSSMICLKTKKTDCWPPTLNCSAHQTMRPSGSVTKVISMLLSKRTSTLPWNSSSLTGKTGKPIPMISSKSRPISKSTLRPPYQTSSGSWSKRLVTSMLAIYGGPTSVEKYKNPMPKNSASRHWQISSVPLMLPRFETVTVRL